MPDRPPRILEVLYSFRVGGSEVVGLDLARLLAARGAEVLCTAIDGLDGPLRERCAALGLSVVDLHIPGQNIFGRNGLSLGLTSRLRDLGLDAIHLQHFVSLNKLGLPARLAGVRRIVVTEHSEADLRASLAGRLRLRLSWRLADAITVIHEGIKQYLIDDIGITADRITVIPNGIDMGLWHREDRAECRRQMGLGSDFVFAFVGRVTAVKNVPGLITAFLEARRRTLDQPARLLIVGDGDDMDKCRALAGNHPLGYCVTFAGEQRDTRPYLAAADAFVMNSRSEGTPRALLEAMAMGLPCVGPAVGGIPDMLQGCGWLTQPDDPESLVQAIVATMLDVVQAAEFGALARVFVASNYDADRVLTQYQGLLYQPRSLPVLPNP